MPLAGEGLCPCHCVVPSWSRGMGAEGFESGWNSMIRHAPRGTVTFAFHSVKLPRRTALKMLSPGSESSQVSAQKANGYGEVGSNTHFCQGHAGATHKEARAVALSVPPTRDTLCFHPFRKYAILASMIVTSQLVCT